MASAGFSRLLAEVKSSVTELGADSEPGKALSSAKVDKLRSVVFSLKTSIGLRQRCRPSDADQGTLWNAVCDVWVRAGLSAYQQGCFGLLDSGAVCEIAAARLCRQGAHRTSW